MSAQPNARSYKPVSPYTQDEFIRTLRRKGISDERVLQAMRCVPRHLFVNDEYTHLAYHDQSLPIGHQQTISQPYIVAYMTQTLLQKPIETVLEIGTGCGYQTAVLAQLIARVFTIERIGELSREARRRLRTLGYKNIHFRSDDGSLGWRQFAPYQAIIVTAAAATLPKKLYHQLTPKGRMIIPLGEQRKSQTLAVVTPTLGGPKIQPLMGVKFVPLVQQ